MPAGAAPPRQMIGPGATPPCSARLGLLGEREPFLLRRREFLLTLDQRLCRGVELLRLAGIETGIGQQSLELADLRLQPVDFAREGLEAVLLGESEGGAPGPGFLGSTASRPSRAKSTG